MKNHDPNLISLPTYSVTHERLRGNDSATVAVDHSAKAYDSVRGLTMKTFLVPVMLLTAGLLMSFAWIGHLRFKSLTFLGALAMSWTVVLPEYILNVFSVRWGRDQFSGAQMAAIHLASGVVCVALIARLFLGETLRLSQFAGFVLMAVAISLILIKF